RFIIQVRLTCLITSHLRLRPIRWPTNMLHLTASNVWPPPAVSRPLDVNISEILLNLFKLKNRPDQLLDIASHMQEGQDLPVGLILSTYQIACFAFTSSSRSIS